MWLAFTEIHIESGSAFSTARANATWVARLSETSSAVIASSGMKCSAGEYTETELCFEYGSRFGKRTASPRLRRPSEDTPGRSFGVPSSIRWAQNGQLARV